MVDSLTYNKMSSNEQDEYEKYGTDFIQAVFKSKAIDGIDFAKKYKIKSDGDIWYISHMNDNVPLANIKTNSKFVIEALWANAAQNYGR